MKVSFNTEGQIVIDCEGKERKEPDIIYINESRRKTYQGCVDKVRVSVGDDSSRYYYYPIRISIVEGGIRGLPHDVFSGKGTIPGDVLTIEGARALIGMIQEAINTACGDQSREANNGL